MKKLLLFVIFSICVFIGNAQFSNAPVSKSTSGPGIVIVYADSVARIEPIKYYKTKAGSGALLSGLTYGLAKTKSKNYYKGATSPNKVKVGDKFRFTFGELPPAEVVSMYMFMPGHTIRNFSLIEFEKKKKERELVTGEFGAWTGYSGGVNESNNIEFTVEEIEPNVYEATITKGLPGEYGFVFTDNGVGAYQSVFDFSLCE